MLAAAAQRGRQVRHGARLAQQRCPRSRGVQHTGRSKQQRVFGEAVARRALHQSGAAPHSSLHATAALAKAHPCCPELACTPTGLGGAPGAKIKAEQQRHELGQGVLGQCGELCILALLSLPACSGLVWQRLCYWPHHQSCPCACACHFCQRLAVSVRSGFRRWRPCQLSRPQQLCWADGSRELQACLTQQGGELLPHNHNRHACKGE